VIRKAQEYQKQYIIIWSVLIILILWAEIYRIENHRSFVRL